MDYNEYRKALLTTPTSYLYPDPGLRWKPDSVNVPEQLGYSSSAALPLTGVTKLQFLHRTANQVYSFPAQPQLLEVDFPNLTTNKGIDFHSCTLLAHISAPEIVMPTAGLVSIKNTAIPAADVDFLYNTLAVGLQSVTYTSTIDTSGTTAAPTAASATARTALAAKGVTVTHS